jgi:hypothetical protein
MACRRGGCCISFRGHWLRLLAGSAASICVCRVISVFLNRPSPSPVVRTPRGTLGPQTLNLPDVQIDASKVPYRIRRQAYRHLGKLVS